ncbi:MAG: sulfatase-like hydrolase/transferase, partial [Planctomycetota bacterium]
EAHGVVDFRSCWLADEVETLAEALQDAGYSTAGFSGNPLVSRARNFDQGFEVFETSPEVVKSDWVVPRALKWLEQHREQRFFLYLQLHDAHVPHTPRRQDLERLAGVSEPRFDPMRMQAQTYVLKSAAAHTADDRPRPELLMQPGEARWYSEVYDACVATGDHWLGVVLEQLEDFGLSENTLIVYTSDHGEELLDHGLLNHNHELWQELVHVPLIVAGPGIPVGRRVSTPVANRHLAPTLATRLGARLDAPRDALDLFADETPGGPVFFDTSHGWWKGRQFVPLLGVREGAWVLHWSPQGKAWDAPPGADPAGGQVRLFHLERDPREQRDVSAQHPERVQRMRELLLRHRSRAAQDRPLRKRRAGAATLEILRGAGYTGTVEDE